MFEFTSEKIAIIAACSILAWLCLFFIKRRKNQYPYFSCETLLTPAELKFYTTLKAAVHYKYDIACKVRLADIINCSDINWQKGFGPKISSKHIDFVLFDAKSSQIRLCIELDDKSHLRPDRVKRDKFINNALAAANVALLRIPVSKGYDLATIESSIAIKIKKNF